MFGHLLRDVVFLVPLLFSLFRFFFSVTNRERVTSILFISRRVIQ